MTFPSSTQSSTQSSAQTPVETSALTSDAMGTASLDEAAVTQSRKADHIRICLDEDVQFRQTSTGFERYRFTHCCLPELNWDDIQLATTFLDKSLRSPLLISSMTGGTEQARQINYRLAAAAQQYGIAMGVGSQRVAVENPDVVSTFDVRAIAPDILLLANLGAVQLNYSYGLDECKKAVDWLQADALVLHINPLQECVQSRGDTNFRGLFDKIETLCSQISVPVIAKEVGNGISGAMAKRLLEVGISAIDVAGAGGTSWAKVEGERAEDSIQRRLGQTFGNWGIPTADCIQQTRQVSAEVPLIASGGLRNGLDAAVAIALGADLAGMAYPFLKAASESEEAVHGLVEVLLAELTTVLFCTGSETLEDLRRRDVLQNVH
ncbi:MAG: type 2 isopentenyl-diphosphate Delta-isomerase [Leptolyngbyaceae bacterium]|nr:type 2 isopentenyl-diphosphate Delta-isomerase [Leptolyngbyaceae bacterium]